MIAFVVLHYQNILDTKETVLSIQDKIGVTDYAIVIIDNASPNNSGLELKQYYSNNTNIFVILNTENVGFAKGNNIGYSFAKHELQAQYIIMMNNDVNIMTENFGNKIQDIYRREKYSVLGPMIISADGRCDSNPVSLNLRSKEEIKSNLRFYKKMVIYIKIGFLPLQQMVVSIRKLVKKKETYVPLYIKMQKNVRLHGCFWIFSPEYIGNYDGIDNRTFMYMEEDILQYHMVKDERSMIYTPEIIVFHKEGASTGMSTDKKKKLLCKYRWLIESNKLLLELLQNEFKIQ